ncbi:hypothetical protein MOV08_37270 [Streptomyces yunnanensis]|uniref:Uncharacterized protein n=1 Tax=Streptomyces yunnanensis TaxID=156453 RepID=A0ABY8AH94_9ACTN|nr:hypothetical protein [Streptomyces yunnanensis]WEB44395.1 hypothetical protein MOV08_37270 [Streptomyces yunnanensis]
MVSGPSVEALLTIVGSVDLGVAWVGCVTDGALEALGLGSPGVIALWVVGPVVPADADGLGTATPTDPVVGLGVAEAADPVEGLGVAEGPELGFVTSKDATTLLWPGLRVHGASPLSTRPPVAFDATRWRVRSPAVTVPLPGWLKVRVVAPAVAVTLKEPDAGTSVVAMWKGTVRSKSSCGAATWALVSTVPPRVFIPTMASHRVKLAPTVATALTAMGVLGAPTATESGIPDSISAVNAWAPISGDEHV